MTKTLSGKLPCNDVLSTYCTTSASTHTYKIPIRPAKTIPIETGFTKNREHKWNDTASGEHQWQSTYTASHNESSIIQNREGYNLHAAPTQLSSFSKQNYSNYQTASYAGVQSESKSAYSIVSFQQSYGKDLNFEDILDYKCSENGYTRNFAIDRDRLQARQARTPHSEFEDKYQSPIANHNIAISECNNPKTNASISGYSKSCIALQQTSYGPDLNTTMKSSYQKKLQRRTAVLPVENDEKGQDMSGYVNNACFSEKRPDSNRHYKGLVNNRYLKEGNIELYTTPKISTNPARPHLENHQYDLTPSPLETIITHPPMATKADLSDKLTHWKAS